MPSSRLDRRHVLQLFAAAPLGAALAAPASCAPADLPDPTAAWRSPGAGEQDPRRHALAHAILAPNPHNMQPWLVELTGADSLTLRADLTRLLPATDPPNRQITIGCGAFLELLDIAARENGHRAEITLWPEGEPQPLLDVRPIANVRLVADPAIAKDPLYAEIVRRRTNRMKYDLAAPPSAATLDQVAAQAGGAGLTYGHTATPAETARMRDLVWRAWTREMATPAALAESVAVMRIGKAEIAQHRDGISIDGPLVPLLKAIGALDRKALLDPKSQANAEGAKPWKAMADTSPAFLWMRAGDNSRAAQIAVGRAYARLNLAANAAGLGIHPWSMPLQEYAEVGDLYRETQALLGATPEAPIQMLVRIGRPLEDQPPAPRRGLAEHLRA